MVAHGKQLDLKKLLSKTVIPYIFWLVYRVWCWVVAPVVVNIYMVRNVT